jgi:3-deoxy-manno-octulosonate cytidylyltransferase (CMP-KDO synthetase)
MTNLVDKSAIVIPIRMGSTRLPGKFHLDIAGKAMILHVIDRARESNIKNIFVACDHLDHYKLIEDYGAKAILTSVDHQSGSDRVYEAIEKIDPNGNFEYIVNLQGDIPFVKPDTINSVLEVLQKDEKADIATMLSRFKKIEDVANPNFVKCVFNINHHALYFSRSIIPFDMANLQPEYYHHVGIYAYKRQALKRFVNLAQTNLEINEKLEQLRALENGMVIKLGFTDDLPISVDVAQDLEIARNYLNKSSF